MADIEGSSILVSDNLSGAGQYIINASETITNELSALVNQLTPISETWTGAAADYYQGLQQEWNVAAAGLFGPGGVLGQIANAMNINWNNYSDAEWANVKTWQPGAGA